MMAGQTTTDAGCSQLAMLMGFSFCSMHDWQCKSRLPSDMHV